MTKAPYRGAFVIRAFVIDSSFWFRHSLLWKCYAGHCPPPPHSGTVVARPSPNTASSGTWSTPRASRSASRNSPASATVQPAAYSSDSRPSGPAAFWSHCR